MDDATAEMVGALLGLALVLVIPITLLLWGGRRKRASDGRRGKVMTVIGWVLLALVVLGLLGQASQLAQS